MSALDELAGEREQREREDELMRIVRGINAVDRAVRAAAAAVPFLARPQPIPLDVGQRMGWLVCARCGRPLERSWRVERGGEVFHPVCIAIVLREPDGLGRAA